MFYLNAGKERISGNRAQGSFFASVDLLTLRQGSRQADDTTTSRDGITIVALQTNIAQHRRLSQNVAD